MTILNRFRKAQEDWGLKAGIMPDFNRHSLVITFLNWATQQPAAAKFADEPMSWNAQTAEQVWAHLLSSYGAE